MSWGYSHSIWSDEHTAMAARVMSVLDPADTGPVKEAVCDVANRWPTDTSKLGSMLSQDYTWNTAFPQYVRSKMDSLVHGDRVRLAMFVKHAVFGRLASTRTVDSEVKAQCEADNYQYMAYSDWSFLDMLSRLPRKKGMKFIDIGSGIGVKPFLAWLYSGYEAHGIELNSHTYELSRYFLDDFLLENYVHDYDADEYNGSMNMTHGDAFDYTYEQYDVIYMYRPIANSIKLDLLYKHVYSTMRDDAVMVEAVGDYGVSESLPGARMEIPSHDHDYVFIYKGG